MTQPYPRMDEWPICNGDHCIEPRGRAWRASWHLNPTDFAVYLAMNHPELRRCPVARESTRASMPYYGGSEGFSRVLDLVEAASAGLLLEIGSARSIG